jgi:hypothetical protein
MPRMLPALNEFPDVAVQQEVEYLVMMLTLILTMDKTFGRLLKIVKKGLLKD